MTTIYVDNAATTKTSRTAIEAMLPYFDKIYGNPSSLHSVGQAAADALRKAREEAAEVLGCEPNEITFTSGGSEADNQALVSAAGDRCKKGQEAYNLHRVRASCDSAYAKEARKRGL